MACERTCNSTNKCTRSTNIQRTRHVCGEERRKDMGEDKRGGRSNEKKKEKRKECYLLGLASVSKEAIESNTFDTVSAGLQLSFNMSKHI